MKVFKSRQSQRKKEKVKSQSRVDHVLRYEGHHPRRVFATELNDQSASQQEDPSVYASLSAREEIRVEAGQIMAASLRQCTCSQRSENLLC